MKQILLKTLSILAIATQAATLQAERIVHIPMELNGRQVTETVTNSRFMVQGALAPMSAQGAIGKAVRFDGYSNFVSARLTNESLNATMTQMTVSLWCAVETYPIMAHDQESDEKAMIAGNIDTAAKTGFAFYVGRDGGYSFECYSGGWQVTCRPSGKLPCYQWNHLVAVIDCASREVKLYNNGKVVATSRCMDTVSMTTGTLTIGRSTNAIYHGPFQLNTFNGIIDEISIYNTALSEAEITAMKAESEADLSIPASRYTGDLMRPRFHAMPGMNWTNECHGLVKYDGQYHLFFQKNGNGPYMSRLQWGHVVSDNLATWKEVPIALETDKHYDIKGCWSGCVFTDNELTGGRPNIFYTAVDYGRATIAQASPSGNGLLKWVKRSDNPVVNGRPEGLSDDFRDPYVFRADNGNYYMIVGTSKNNLGATTLHRYDKSSKTWSNDGAIFFSAKSNISGRFWEMPTMNKIGDKWIFTATPLETTQGVEVQYWTGTINADGTFNTAMTTPGKVELEGMSRDGYGLLSPAITECDGKTIVMGIVPDKLADTHNYQMGWAHTYSLPREWSIDNSGKLVQKPYSGLSVLRTETKYSESNVTLNGSRSLSPVSGRMVEVQGTFTVSPNATEMGFELLKDGNKSLKLYYQKQFNKIVVDMTSLDRWVNDGGVYNGLYESTLPNTIATGSTVKIHAFLDHSILDVFINDTWAFSVRVFATNANAKGVEAFSKGECTVKSLNAWTLSPNGQGGSSGGGGGDTPSTTEDDLKNAKIGYLIPYASTAEVTVANEKAPLTYFQEVCKSGSVITTNDINKISTANYEAIWVHIDRTGLTQGYANLPFSNQTITALKNYVSDGGNLYLSKHATQLIVPVGRVGEAFAPSIFSSGEGGNGTDVWTVNAQIGYYDPSQCYDQRGHAIYKDMESGIYNNFEHETFPLEGTGNGSEMWREDHNCMWDFNAITYTADGDNTVDKFQKETNSVVLGAWGQVVDHACAGIIEFNPTNNVKGRIIANGLAAYEWSPRSGVNAYHDNIKRLTANTLAYLSPKTTSVIEPTLSHDVTIWGMNKAVYVAGVEGDATVAVYSIDGRLVAQQNIYNDSTISVDMKGIAIVRVVTSFGTFAQKVVIK